MAVVPGRTPGRVPVPARPPAQDEAFQPSLLSGFPGEFLIFKGAFSLAMVPTAIAVLGLLFTAITFLRAMQMLFSGPLPENCAALSDLVRREKFVVVPVTLLMFAVGIAPQFLFNIFNSTVVQMTRLFA